MKYDIIPVETNVISFGLYLKEYIAMKKIYEAPVLEEVALLSTEIMETSGQALADNLINIDEFLL